jgi:repressor LexA
MMKISDKQVEMLAFIENFMMQNGYPPTYEEIRTGLDISTKSLVDYHLAVLESANLLTRVPNTPRGIRLNSEGSHQNGWSNGKNTARLGDLDDKDIIELTFDFVTNESKLYALKVDDETMLDGFVNAGDIVILQHQDCPQNGDLVAVRLAESNQPRFKRYYRENGHVRLLTANNGMPEPIVVAADALEIQGKVVAVIRQVE